MNMINDHSKKNLFQYSYEHPTVVSRQTRKIVNIPFKSGMVSWMYIKSVSILKNKAEWDLNVDNIGFRF